MDWAQKLIEKIKGAASTDAEHAFIEAYKDGDSVEAFTDYASRATQDITLEAGRETVLVFPDGSCWASWCEGVDKFYETVSDMTDDWPEISGEVQK